MTRWPAEQLDALQLAVWRQVSEHLEIDACCDALRTRLARDMALKRLWVRRLDRAHGWIETVSATPWDPRVGAMPSRRTLSVDELALVERWTALCEVEIPPGRLSRLILPEGALQGPVLAGGLVDDGQPVGVVLWEGADPTHVDLFRALLDPLVVALRNDRRMHELARLREAVEAENRALLSRLARDGIGGTVVGAEAGLREVMARVQQVGQTEAPVLVLGETGTGKELIAREIHVRSPRARGPFLKVNCGAIPTELVDSELFGHEKGSFTGAVAERRGWFERADGGTLFLDEIGELPPHAQVRLLRVLQDGSFERVGGQKQLHADVRIVAATHRDLREMVADGRFRQDLWYRICVFPIRLPALRERMDDLAALARHFAARAGERLHGRPLVPTDEDLQLLAAYPWPGNVRELGAVVERAAILGDGHGLDVAMALGVVESAPTRPALPSPTGFTIAASTLEDVNRRAIEEALARTGGRIEGRTGAAARLGLKPSTLRSRMKRFGIDWRGFRPAAD